MGSQSIRVAIADDSHMIREALTAMLTDQPGIELVGVCADGAELEATIAAGDVDAVVIDIRMPPSGDTEGIRLATLLRQSDPQVGVVVLSQFVESAYAVELMRDGTAGRAYLLKERVRDRGELLNAICAVVQGGSVIDPAVVDALVEGRSRDAHSPLAALTPRELQILAEIAEGKSNAAIAASLELTQRAVEKHINSIFAKLDLPGPQDVSRRVMAAILFLAQDQRLRPSARS
ncbi:MAG: response regulator transcription factor [Solirubrobacteraceae bacterium]